MDALDQSPVFNKNLQHKTLDITGFKEKGKQLHDAIVAAVKDTQRIIITDLPDEILMTQTQFDNLQKTRGMMESTYIEDFYLYNTDLNIMEVRVKG